MNWYLLIEEGLSCSKWGSAPCGTLSSKLVGECSHDDGGGSTENIQCARWVQATAYVISDNFSLVKASHLAEVKVKEWAGHPALSGNTQVHGRDTENNEQLKPSRQASATYRALIN